MPEERKRKAGAPAATPAAAAPASQAGSKKRRKRKAAADDSQLSQVELARRQRQRELRDLAIKLRGQGKEYNPKKHRKHKPRRRVALIIIPIFWNKKAAEKAAVLGAAEKIQELLRGAGVKCDTDTTTELTPGQKMRSWEEKGVLLRVELGAKEVEAGAAVVARCTTPGEVAQRQTVAVGEPLLQLVKRHLQELGIALQPPASTDGAAAEADGGAGAAAGAGADEQEQQEGQQHGQASAPQQAAEEQQQQQQVGGAGNPAKKGKKALPSGDDLEGDFAAVQLLPDKNSKGKKGKRRDEAAAAKAAEVEASVFGSGGGEEEAPAGKAKKAKKHKTVKF